MRIQYNFSENSIVRYIVIGLSLLFADWLVFFAMLLLFDSSVSVAQIVGRSFGALCGFLGHKYYSFRSKGTLFSSQAVSQAAGYILVALFNIAISPVFLHFILFMTANSLIISKLILEVMLAVQTYLFLALIFNKHNLALQR